MKKYLFPLFLFNIAYFILSSENFIFYCNVANLLDINFEKSANSFFKESLFYDKATRLLWIDKLQAIYKAYKKNFTKIEFFLDDKNNFDAIFYLKNKKKFYFSDGKMLPKDKLKNKDKYVDYFYSSYYNHSNYKIYSKYLISKKNDYDFYFSIYGKNKNEILDNLIKLTFLKKSFYFNKKNKASSQLNKIFQEIDNNKSSKNYFTKNIKIISTFNYRNILYQNKLSLHSFGIAIDIIPKDKNKFIYWYWAIPFVDEWWKIKENEKFQIPKELIEIFESHFFYWGGRWYMFDIMHFEYKPEIFYKRVK